MTSRRPGIHFATLTVLFLLPAAHLAASEEPPSTSLALGEATHVLTAIADRVEAHYVDEDKGREIAEAPPTSRRRSSRRRQLPIRWRSRA